MAQPAQSSEQATTPRHVAIIMDGNGRWAKQRSRPRTFGHAEGVEALRRTVEAAGERGAHRFHAAVFQAPAPSTRATVVAWAWSEGCGNTWSSPTFPRLAFGTAAVLKKLYVSYEVELDERGEGEPLFQERRLRELLEAMAESG